MNLIKNQPLHVGLIIDGNGRWATKKGKDRLYGHKHGLEKIIYETVNWASEFQIKYLTLSSSIDLFEGLRHITLYPAQILNLDDKIGSLEVGKLANFNVFKLNYNENFTSILNKDNPQYVYYKGKMLVGNGNII